MPGQARRSPDQWKTGGGNVWGWITYDPESNLIYYGTANPGPWNPEQRPGDNKWTSSVFARDPDTGLAKWALQYNPHDLHDYDGVNEHVLIDLTIKGQKRKALVHPDRNGFMYVMDRITGEILSAEPFVHTTSTLKVDLQTGKPLPNPEKEPKEGVKVNDICPAAPGGKDWQPSAYPAHGFTVRAAQPSLHGRHGFQGQLYCRHTLSRYESRHG